MIQIPAGVHIVLVHESVDFRKGIDGLQGYCRQILSHDPMSGALFVFRNKCGDALRTLSYDSQGFWLCTKRLSKGKFFKVIKNDHKLSQIGPAELMLLLWGGDPSNIKLKPVFKKIVTDLVD